MPKEILNINEVINQNCCFDLQFRKDVRHERTGSPTYYRWKVEFIITLPKENLKELKKIKNILGCGIIAVNKNQTRFSVQKQEDINNFIIPFCKKNKLEEKKKKNFELWQKAVNIIYKNKGKYINKWNKSDLLNLIQIHQFISQYKHNSRKAKWMEMAKTIAKIKNV